MCIRDRHSRPKVDLPYVFLSFKTSYNPLAKNAVANTITEDVYKRQIVVKSSLKIVTLKRRGSRRSIRSFSL